MALVREFEQLIARDITHRAVVAPVAAGLDGDAAYLAMEYVVGDSLDVSSRDIAPMPMGTHHATLSETAVGSLRPSTRARPAASITACCTRAT